MDVGSVMKYNQRIPDSWVVTTLGEIRFDSSASINPSKFPNQYFELYSVPSFAEKKPEIILGKEIGSNKQIISENTVLLCKINPRINRVWVVGNFTNYKKIASTEWISFFTIKGLNPKYLSYYLQNSHLRNFLASNVSGVGGSLMRVKPNTIKDYPFPLPTENEQRRIVAKIEELFTKLDAGVAALKEAQKLLKRYRQSVLKAAVEGRLTAEWREKHKDELEPADKLLERIQEERKAKLGKKYKGPKPVDTTNLPELPEGWVWVTLGHVTNLITKGSSPRWQGFDYVNKGVMFIRSQNVLWGELDISKIVFLPASFNKKESKSILKNGDLLLNIVGASIGRVAIATEKVNDANINQAVALIRLVHGGLVNKFLLYYLLSVDAQSKIRSETVDVARANLSLRDVSELCIPFPPIKEQIKVIDEVELLFSIIDQSEIIIESLVKRAQSLRYSILKHAFEGKLVPQDPSDEPANELIKRIRMAGKP